MLDNEIIFHIQYLTGTVVPQTFLIENFEVSVLHSYYSWMLSTLLTLNIVVSLLHSIKHVPQCIHMVRHENADGLSMQYIQGEMLLNLLSVIASFKIFLTLHHAFYLLPILIEKTVALNMICVMCYLKQKYSNSNDDWYSVDSIDDNDDDDDDWYSVDSIDSLDGKK